MSTVISVENVSKLYRLGEIGTGSLSHDVNRWWHKVRGREDPYLKIGQSNDRTSKGDSDYVYALKDVSFEVKQGEVLGIIGRNGAGKSTLLKILSRVTTPSTGEIKAKGRIASLLEVGTGFHPELSGRDNIYLNGAILGMRKHEIDRKFDEIVEFSGCERYIDTPVKRYSSGMYVRLAFAVAAHLESEILIVDEVLAVGDVEFQAKCMGKMKDVAVQGRTVLFVSHNMDVLEKLCRSAVMLEKGIVSQTGSASEIVRAYAMPTKTVESIQFPAKPNLPHITHVKVELPNNHFNEICVKIGFSSPFSINHLVPGIVLKSSLGTPILSSNPKIHRSEETPNGLRSGTAEISIKNIVLKEGYYNISVWLGDARADYDEHIDVLHFFYPAKSLKGSVLPKDYIGLIDMDAEWRFMEETV